MRHAAEAFHRWPARRLAAAGRGLASAAFALVLALQPTASAFAQGISLIRDAEIERSLLDLATPVFRVAGIDPDDIKIYIVNDDELNAFVAGGMNLFLNTGLLMRTATPDQLLGVIAHETGHIAGGHLTRFGPAADRATAEVIMAAVLGAAAAAAGAPQVAGALIAGGAQYAQAGLTRFTRGQEQAADQAALTFLDRLDLSAEGLADFLQVLQDSNILRATPSPFLLSHPLTQDRITIVENHVAARPDAGTLSGAPVAEHARMVAKLQGFIEPPQRTLADRAGDDSLPGRYARAVALYRVPDLGNAVAAIDGLLDEHPDDPYFHELKGQMLFENGRVGEAVEPYAEAVRLLPDEALLRTELGRALSETGRASDLVSAEGQLREAVRLDDDDATSWRLLGITLGRQGKGAEADLALAEHALLTDRHDDAELFLRRAERGVPRGGRDWLRLQDLRNALADARAEADGG